MDLIIEIGGGIVTGVYTYSPENITVRVIDEDDKHDEERFHEYHAMRKLIESGAVTDVLYGDSTSDETPAIKLPELDPNAFLLIRQPEAVKTETGRRVQHLSSAFIDGYLDCHAEICKFARKFIKDNPDVNIDFPGFYKIMKPLLERQNQTYNGLCEALNRSEEFDCDTSPLRVGNAKIAHGENSLGKKRKKREWKNTCLIDSVGLFRSRFFIVKIKKERINYYD